MNVASPLSFVVTLVTSFPSLSYTAITAPFNPFVVPSSYFLIVTSTLSLSGSSGSTGLPSFSLSISTDTTSFSNKFAVTLLPDTADTTPITISSFCSINVISITLYVESSLYPFGALISLITYGYVPGFTGTFTSLIIACPFSSVSTSSFCPSSNVTMNFAFVICSFDSLSNLFIISVYFPASSTGGSIGVLPSLFTTFILITFSSLLVILIFVPSTVASFITIFPSFSINVISNVFSSLSRT